MLGGSKIALPGRMLEQEQNGQGIPVAYHLVWNSFFMSQSSPSTRSRILDAAELLILDYGFAGTTVDAVVGVAGVTKGAFFHYFASKAELAHAIVKRYAERDAEHLESTLARAERLSRDPLQQLLIAVGLFEEQMEALTEPFPGCLFASYCYQSQLFDNETLEIGRRSMHLWRDRVTGKLEEISERYPARVDVDLESLGDMLLTIFEGAFVLSRTLDDPTLVARQLANYRAYVGLLFVDPRE